ncbi:MAG: hypoxanthine phosphoribosyltransferase [Acidimicrobiales bacterium]
MSGAPTGARVLIPSEQLHTAIRRLAGEVSRDHPDGVLLVAVLKGSTLFLADLVRALSVPVEVDFLAVSSYAPETGRVRIVKDLELDVADREVILVEDIVDTGLTLTYLLGQLERRAPRTLEVCTLLDKACRRIVPTALRYVGFEIGDDFVLGYGMDFAERYRNLDHVVAGDLRALQDDPDAHVAELFGR